MFAEDLSDFVDADTGFGVVALVNGVSATIIFDAPGAEALGGEVVTTEPSALIQASVAVSIGNALVLAGGDLPSHSAGLAGTYRVRSISPEPPDGAFKRVMLAKE